MPAALHGSILTRESLLDLASVGGTGQPMVPPMQLALEASFGSVAQWRVEALPVDGDWRLLVFAPERGRLEHRTLAEPLPARIAGIPILAIEARSTDSPLVDWDLVYARYQDAVHKTSDGLRVAPDAVGQATLIDVRRAGAYNGADSCLPGATWRDPATVGDWADELPRDAELVVYCVHGHEVSRATAMRLHAAGLKVHYMEGGIDGWLVAGGKMVPKTKEPAPGN